MKGRLGIVLFLIFLAGCGDSASVRTVKAGKLAHCSQQTVEQAVNRLFISPKWTSCPGPGWEAAEEVLVQVTGKIRAQGQEMPAQLHFIIDESNGNIDVLAFELSGVRQQNAMSFFAKACE